MTKLRERYERETGKEAVEGLNSPGCGRYSAEYVAWLEAECERQSACAEELAAALRAICEMQHQHYGYGTETHLGLRDLCVPARATLAKYEAAKGGE